MRQRCARVRPVRRAIRVQEFRRVCRRCAANASRLRRPEVRVQWRESLAWFSSFSKSRSPGQGWDGEGLELHLAEYTPEWRGAGNAGRKRIRMRVERRLRTNLFVGAELMTEGDQVSVGSENQQFSLPIRLVRWAVDIGIWKRIAFLIEFWRKGVHVMYVAVV